MPIDPAPVRAPATQAYRGAVTDPARWSTWTPRRGDILVSTPPKSGTTWTQTILTMLVCGRTDLPAPVPVLSPWVDADLGIPGGEVAAALDRQPGRRVVKTHTPGDGFPVWDGVTVVAVYRHPLDVFFSLRGHVANKARPKDDHPMGQPLDRAFAHFVEGPADPEDFDSDTLATIARHYARTALGRAPRPALFHYADLLCDGRAAVARLAGATGIAADDALVRRIAEATTFAAMKADAAAYAPAGGTGYWSSDANFFDSGTTGKWQGALSPDHLARYAARLAELVPDAGARAWLEGGERR